MDERWGRRPFQWETVSEWANEQPDSSPWTNQRPGNISPQLVNCNPIHPNPPEFCFNDCSVAGSPVRVPRVRRIGECLGQMLVTIRHWRYLDTICLLSSSKLARSEAREHRWVSLKKSDVVSRKRMWNVVRLWHPHLNLTVAARHSGFLMHRINFQNEDLIP